MDRPTSPDPVPNDVTVDNDASLTACASEADGTGLAFSTVDTRPTDYVADTGYAGANGKSAVPAPPIRISEVPPPTLLNPVGK